MTCMTTREQQVIQHIWDGLANREIAALLGLSCKTIEAHRANIYRKLRITKVADLLRIALEEKLIKVNS